MVGALSAWRCGAWGVSLGFPVGMSAGRRRAGAGRESRERGLVDRLLRVPDGPAPDRVPRRPHHGVERTRHCDRPARALGGDRTSCPTTRRRVGPAAASVGVGGCGWAWWVEGDPAHLEAFTQWMLVAAGGLGWWPGRWSRNRGGVHHPAKTVGEHQPVGVVGVAGDPQPAAVMQAVMPRTQTRQIPCVRRAGAVVGIPVDHVMDVQEPIRGAARARDSRGHAGSRGGGCVPARCAGCVRH